MVPEAWDFNSYLYFLKVFSCALISFAFDALTSQECFFSTFLEALFPYVSLMVWFKHMFIVGDRFLLAMTGFWTSGQRFHGSRGAMCDVMTTFGEDPGVVSEAAPGFPFMKTWVLLESFLFHACNVIQYNYYCS